MLLIAKGPIFEGERFTYKMDYKKVSVVITLEKLIFHIRIVYQILIDAKEVDSYVTSLPVLYSMLQIQLGQLITDSVILANAVFHHSVIEKTEADTSIEELLNALEEPKEEK